jgi:hypothetical protein
MDSIQSLSEASRKALELEFFYLDIQKRTLKYWNWGSERGGPIPPRDQALHYSPEAQRRIRDLGREKESRAAEEIGDEDTDNGQAED